MFSIIFYGMTLFDIIIIGLCLILIVIFMYMNNKITTESTTNRVLASTLLEERDAHGNIDFSHSDKALTFLDRIIEDKYNYYMYNVLIPIYMDHRVPEKKIISELKEKIYVSVVGGLHPNIKRSLLTIFNEKGIEIYIHEKIIIYMNKTDFKTSGKYTEAFRDVPTSRVGTLIP